MKSSLTLRQINVVLLPTVQARIQSPRAVRHRLHCQTVETPVWHGEGRLCAALQQEHHLHLPAPLPLPIRWQGQDVISLRLFCHRQLCKHCPFCVCLPWAEFKSNKLSGTWSQWRGSEWTNCSRSLKAIWEVVCVWLWSVNDFDGWTWQSVTFSSSSQGLGLFPASRTMHVFCVPLSLNVCSHNRHCSNKVQS